MISSLVTMISLHPETEHRLLKKRFTRPQHCGWEPGVVWRVGEVLRLEAQPVVSEEGQAAPACLRAVEEVTRVQLEAGLCRVYLHGPPAPGLASPRAEP